MAGSPTRDSSATASATIHLHLVADWTPSASPQLARFDLVVKLGPGAMRPAGPALLRCLDATGAPVSQPAPALWLPDTAWHGPVWQHIRGRHLALDGSVAEVELDWDRVGSQRRSRSEATQALVLEPLAGDLGLPGEPHLGWRFTNHEAMPLSTAPLRQALQLQIDGRRVSAPATAYNGPSQLAPHRTLSGFWSLDQLPHGLRDGSHHFQLHLGDRASAAFDWAWGGAHQ
jgi:hypothetical protein